MSSLDGSPGSNGVTIAADNVDLDLHGFALFGGSNSLNGILVHASNELHNIAIHNGVIGEWGGRGIDAANAFDSSVSQIKLYMNMGGGMTLGNHTQIKECDAIDNGATGIQVGDASNVSDCKSMDNNPWANFLLPNP